MICVTTMNALFLPCPLFHTETIQAFPGQDEAQPNYGQDPYKLGRKLDRECLEESTCARAEAVTD